MSREIININEDFIRLQDLIKFAGITPTGGQAKYLIQNGEIKVNGEVCTMRGKKMRDGDIAQFEDRIIEVKID
ncbi:MAG: RNA-binding S4 domain-containing protein [Eubacteriales bacterium]|nr:RNA-binding S4 domain-containing protein [Eubacteriales bacterium]